MNDLYWYLRRRIDRDAARRRCVDLYATSVLPFLLGHREHGHRHSEGGGLAAFCDGLRFGYVLGCALRIADYSPVVILARRRPCGIPNGESGLDINVVPFHYFTRPLHDINGR